MVGRVRYSKRRIAFICMGINIVYGFELFFYYYYYYLNAIGLTPGGSSTVHIYTQAVHRIQRTEHT
jgi:hypothetical protein